MSKSIKKTQSEVKKERVALIESLIIQGLTTTREIHNFIKEDIEANKKSKYDFCVTYETLMMYIRTAKDNVIKKSKPNYLLLSTFLNSELLSIAVSTQEVDNRTRIDALKEIAKLNGLYDIEMMKKMKYDDILSNDDSKDSKSKSLTEKEIRERRESRKSNEERVI